MVDYLLKLHQLILVCENNGKEVFQTKMTNKKSLKIPETVCMNEIKWKFDEPVIFFK